MTFQAIISAERKLSTHFNRAVILFKEGPYSYLSAQKRLDKLSLMANEKTILQALENSLNFCDSVTDVFTDINHCTELKYKV
jgi:hypothetical protein